MQTNYYWAIVTDNIDPDELYRVRVSKVGEKPGMTEWLPVVIPFGSIEAGLNFIPEVDELVLVVCFEGTENEKTVMTTKLLKYFYPQGIGENTEADLTWYSENVLSFWDNKANNQSIIDDTEDEGKIQNISADGKNSFEFNLGDNSGSFTTENDLPLGSDSIGKIKAKEVEIICDNITYTITDAEIQIDAEKNMEIKSYKEIKANGQDISFN